MSIGESISFSMDGVARNGVDIGDPLSFRIGESGKTLRIASKTQFDMSAATELTLVVTKPDGTVVTKRTADGVALGGGVNDVELGKLAVNTYVEYKVESALLDQHGRYHVRLEYEDDTQTPDDLFISETATFVVEPLGP